MSDYTKDYYETHAKDFIENTITCDMQLQYDLLEKHLKPNSSILDIGFGSARDMLYFKSKGFRVIGLDYSKEFCLHARKLGLNEIYNESIMNFNEKFKVDSIWACASLLHLANDDLPLAFLKCFNFLNDEGYMYASFKLGEFKGELNGRYFNYVDASYLESIYIPIGFKLIESFVSNDVRKDKNNQWLNIVLKK